MLVRHIPSEKKNHIFHSPLLVLRVLGADNVDVFTTLSPDAHAAIAQLLHRAAHFHASDLLFAHGFRRGVRGLKAEFLESAGEGLGLGRAARKRRA